jgi:hypothetical protein
LIIDPAVGSLTTGGQPQASPTATTVRFGAVQVRLPTHATASVTVKQPSAPWMQEAWLVPLGVVQSSPACGGVPQTAALIASSQTQTPVAATQVWFALHIAG